jgi:hypothetical protein
LACSRFSPVPWLAVVAGRRATRANRAASAGIRDRVDASIALANYRFACSGRSWVPNPRNGKQDGSDHWRPGEVLKRRAPPGREMLGIELRKGSQEDAAASYLDIISCLVTSVCSHPSLKSSLWELEACLLAHSSPLALPLKMASGYDRALSGNPVKIV